MADKDNVIKGLELLHDRLLDAAKQDSIAMLDASMVADAIILMKEHENIGAELTNAVELIHKKNEQIKKLLKLLEKNEPKQIVRKQGKRENPDGSIDFFGEWYCPNCGKLLNRGFDLPWIEFCYKCGQAIKWNDTSCELRYVKEAQT